ncbi:MAG: glycoside hydrolase domain-containing protein [Terriglobia bacterium]
MSFGSLRLWATETNWNDIEGQGAGQYDWSKLDSWFQLAQQNGMTDLLYTFGVVPPWASSNPNDPTCVTSNSPPGSCDAPKDLNPDGSGPDMIWQNFVTAVVTHSNNSADNHIKYWEVWNEPDIPKEWNGTTAQMVRMAKDAYAIIKSLDPTAMVTTPTPVNGGATNANLNTWMQQFFAGGGSQYADVVTFHGYLNPSNGQRPEMITSVASSLTATKAGAGLTSKPVWDTEGGWGKDADLSDPDLQAAFVARIYLLQWSAGVSRFYWFQYGNQGEGTLWTPSGLTPAGIAYGQVYTWMVGATLASPCSVSGSVWTCNLTKPGGVQTQAVWDASQTCSNGSCGTSSYTPNSTYTKYADLAGNVTSFTPGMPIQIGAKPILLESQ